MTPGEGQDHLPPLFFPSLTHRCGQQRHLQIRRAFTSETRTCFLRHQYRPLLPRRGMLAPYRDPGIDYRLGVLPVVEPVCQGPGIPPFLQPP